MLYPLSYRGLGSVCPLAGNRSSCVQVVKQPRGRLLAA